MGPVQISTKKKLQILGWSLKVREVPIEGVELAGIKQLVDQLCSPTAVPAEGIELVDQVQGVKLTGIKVKLVVVLVLVT